MAVDPQRLQTQLNELARLSGDPERLQRATIELLDDYQIRRRSAGRLQTSVPPPVLRALARTLRTGLDRDPEKLAAAAAALWGAGRRETRSLAAQLLANQDGELVAELVERWTHASVPLELVKELAEVSLEAGRRAAPDRFLARCRSWLRDKNRLLGLYSLQAAVRDPRFENLPRVYELIEGLGGSLRGRPRRAMLELMRALARRAPAETVQFLRDELAQGGAPAKRLVQDLLPSLSSEQREALRAANGIIRAQSNPAKRG